MTLLLSALLSVALAQDPGADPQAAPVADNAAGADNAEGAWLPPTREELIAQLLEEGLDEETAGLVADDILATAALEASLTFQGGEVVLDGGLATLQLGEAYAYLNPQDTATVLEAWGNPPGAETLGMIFPADGSPFDPEVWGVVIQFEEDGYVDDEDAADIDYDELLEEMMASSREESQARLEAGYGKLELVGWAEPPHYDLASHKLYWAKELDAGEPPNTLNYNIRVLGRRGVLEMNAVSSVEQLGQIKGDMEALMANVQFNDGHRYEDFDPEYDKVAAYGIGALVAGKMAAKAGFFKGLLALLMAGKKFVIIGLVALAAFGKSLIAKLRGEE